MSSMKKKNSSKTNTEIRFQKLTKILFRIIVGVTPLNLMFCFIIGLDYGFKNSSNTSGIFWGLLIYSLLLPFIAAWAKAIPRWSRKSLLSKKSISAISIIGMSLALIPIVVACLLAIAQQTLGTSFPLETVGILYLSAYVSGGVILFILCLSALPVAD